MAERTPATPEDLDLLRTRSHVPEMTPEERRRYRQEKETWYASGCLPPPQTSQDFERFLDTLSGMTFQDGEIGLKEREMHFRNINRAFETGALPAWVRSRARVILGITE